MKRTVKEKIEMNPSQFSAVERLLEFKPLERKSQPTEQNNFKKICFIGRKSLSLQTEQFKKLIMSKRTRKGRKWVIEEKLINEILANTHEVEVPFGSQGKTIEELYWFFREVDKKREGYPITKTELNFTLRQVEKKLHLLGKEVKVILYYYEFISYDAFTQSDVIDRTFKGYDLINNTFHLMSVRIMDHTTYTSVLRNICYNVQEMELTLSQPPSYVGRHLFMWASSAAMSEDNIEAALGTLVYNSFYDIRDLKCSILFETILEEFHKALKTTNGETYLDNEKFSLTDICIGSEIFEALKELKDAIALIKKNKKNKKTLELLRLCPIEYSADDVLSLGITAQKKIVTSIGSLIYGFTQSSNLEFDGFKPPLTINDVNHWLAKNDEMAYFSEMEMTEADEDGLYEE